MANRPFDIPPGTDPANCKFCGGIVYWITTKNGFKITVNTDGMFHLEDCPDAPEKKEKGSSSNTEALYAKINALDARITALEGGAGFNPDGQAAQQTQEDLLPANDDCPF